MKINKRKIVYVFIYFFIFLGSYYLLRNVNDFKTASKIGTLFVKISFIVNILYQKKILRENNLVIKNKIIFLEEMCNENK